jgi:hypothetical protein
MFLIDANKPNVEKKLKFKNFFYATVKGREQNMCLLVATKKVLFELYFIRYSKSIKIHVVLW